MKQTSRSGFTIVELLIVIVVIAILAAITVVAYNGIRQRAVESTTLSDLSSYNTAIEAARTTSGTNTYPTTASGAGLAIKDSYDPQYSITPMGSAYCLSVDADNNFNYYSVSNEKTIPSKGNCGDLSTVVGWWPLNNGSRDISGNQLDGQATNVTAVNNFYNTPQAAYQFNGTDSAINCTISPLLQPNASSSFGISAVIKITAHPSSQAGIISNGDNGWALLINSTGKLGYKIGNSTATFSAGASIKLNTWTRVALFYYANPSGNTNRHTTAMSVLGETSGTVSNNSGAAPASMGYGTTPCLIGSYRGDTGTFFNGAIDEVRFHGGLCSTLPSVSPCISSGF